MCRYRTQRRRVLARTMPRASRGTSTCGPTSGAMARWSAGTGETTHRTDSLRATSSAAETASLPGVVHAVGVARVTIQRECGERSDGPDWIVCAHGQAVAAGDVRTCTGPALTDQDPAPVTNRVESSDRRDRIRLLAAVPEGRALCHDLDRPLGGPQGHNAGDVDPALRRQQGDSEGRPSSLLRRQARLRLCRRQQSLSRVLTHARTESALPGTMARRCTGRAIASPQSHPWPRGSANSLVVVSRR